MKNLCTILMLLTLGLFLNSCESSNNSNSSYMASTAIDVVKNNAVEQFSWDNVEVMEPVGMKTISEEDASAQAVMDIRRALMATSNEAALLDVEFTMSDEPVDNGILMFAIESKNAKELTIEMYDEEGFGMVANNNFDVTEGNNYKALNVNTMENGTYVFRLKDAEGKELVREVQVANQ